MRRAVKPEFSIVESDVKMTVTLPVVKNRHGLYSYGLYGYRRENDSGIACRREQRRKW